MPGDCVLIYPDLQHGLAGDLLGADVGRPLGGAEQAAKRLLLFGKAADPQVDLVEAAKATGC